MVKKVISLLFLLFLVGCSQKTKPAQYLVAGTYLEVVSSDPQAGNIVYQECLRLAKLFDYYDPDSEVSSLNKSFNQPTKVSPEMFELLNLAKQLNLITEGVFDPSAAVLFDFWKTKIKQKGIAQLPAEAELAKLKELKGMEFVELDAQNQTVTIKRLGVKIDLGGVAKGYLADKAAQQLKARRISSALINLGGDIYCLGSKSGAAWRVGIKDPKELAGIIAQEDLINEAIATSGNYEQFFEFKGKRYSHIIDPRSGYPVDNNIISVSVISANAVTSDGLATAFFVLGLEATKAFLARNPSTLRVFVVTDESGSKKIHILK